MQRQLFSVTTIAAQLEATESDVKAAAVTLDIPYELSLDDEWYFDHVAIARIREQLA